jgi:hypothetical protein
VKTLKEITPDQCYRGEDGTTMQRENGLTPNENPIGNKWVLRSADGAWIDFDMYRFDLAERHGFTLSHIQGRTLKIAI